MGVRPRRAIRFLVICACLGAPFLANRVAYGDREARPVFRLNQRCLAGEFEPQDAVLVSWCNADESLQAVLSDIVAAISQHVLVLILVPSEEDFESAHKALAQAGVKDGFEFLRVPVDTIWVRDYGPAVLRDADGGFRFIDACYGDGLRLNDDALPSTLGTIFQTPADFAALHVDGGNLVANGDGIAIATSVLLENNLNNGFNKHEILAAFRDLYGIDQMVYLERLEGEPTGHVDMFATFVDTQTVVVGEYDPGVDFVNAAILDRNAARLAKVTTANGPLQVVRLPMPTNFDGNFRTYTNVLFANGVLVVPSYPGVDAVAEMEAVQTYQRLLDDWQIVRVDCTRLIELSGAVHCVTMNLASIPDEPLMWGPPLNGLQTIGFPIARKRPQDLDLLRLPSSFEQDLDEFEEPESRWESYEPPYGRAGRELDIGRD